MRNRSEGPIGVEDLELVLDGNSFVPYYEQIVDRVRTLINQDKLKQGQTFYSEGAIARTLGISKMPVRQAFQKLRSARLAGHCQRQAAGDRVGQCNLELSTVERLQRRDASTRAGAFGPFAGYHR